MTTGADAITTQNDQQTQQISDEQAQQAAAAAAAAEQEAQRQQQQQSQGDQTTQTQEPDRFDALAEHLVGQQDEAAQAAAQEAAFRANQLQTQRQTLQLIGSLGAQVEELKSQLASSGTADEEPLSIEAQTFKRLVNDPSLDEGSRQALQRSWDTIYSDISREQQASQASSFDPEKLVKDAAAEAARQTAATLGATPTPWSSEESLALLQYGQGLSDAMDLQINWNDPQVQNMMLQGVPNHATAKQAEPYVKQNVQALRDRVAARAQGNGHPGVQGEQNPLNGRVPADTTDLPGSNGLSSQTDDEVYNQFMAKQDVIPKGEFFNAMKAHNIPQMRQLINQY